MINRAEIIDEQFKKRVQLEKFPISKSLTTLEDSGLSPSQVVQIFESQIESRQGDLLTRRLRARGETFYTIGSSGHEGNAAIAAASQVSDPAFLHYRSGAFFIQRAKQHHGSTPIYDLMLSYAASQDDPISGGRHKVLGSKALNILPQTSTIASHIPKAVGTAYSFLRASSLGLEGEFDSDGVVLCSFGDASVNHSTALGAFNICEWIGFQKVPIPIVFICEDNGIGISVSTPRGWIESHFSSRPVLRYTSCDGLSVSDTYRVAKEAIHYSKQTKRPSIIHFKTVRLLGHAGSDVESTYRKLKEINESESQDPLLHSARLLIENQILSKEDILKLYDRIEIRMARVGEIAINRPKIEDPVEIMKSIIPPSRKDVLRSNIEKRIEQRKIIFQKDQKLLKEKQHMAKLLNWALADLMLEYPNVLLFGEDVAKKGGVYHVTADLEKKFGRKRVFDSALDETSILGVAIGMAQNGFVPIPEIQFLAYFHNAEDQLRGEASTLSFFSNGQYTNPMVIRVAGLAYQKGFGGHFHNDNSLTIFRDLPGVIVAVPSNGRDAVLMLRRCVEAAAKEQRVVVFVEPIALYMTKDLYEKGDQDWTDHYPDPENKETIDIGEFGIYESHPGKNPDLNIITYGNGFYLSRQASAFLKERKNIKFKIIDLRWISPIDEKNLAKEVENGSPVLIVEECRRSGSPSEGVITALVENMKSLPKIKRITAEDCFIPLGIASTAVLPSKESIVKQIEELLKKTGEVQ